MWKKKLSRRKYLETLAASGIAVGTAGCNALQEDPANSPERATKATPEHAPTILDYGATPEDNGNSLAVYLEGEDDQGIQTAIVRYGGQEIINNVSKTTVTVDDRLTELDEGQLDEKPGRVAYILRDTDGRETRAEVYPDENAPELQNFSIAPTDKAGEIALVLEGRDDVGLEEVRLLLGEQAQMQQRVSGQKDYSAEQKVDIPESARFQQNNVTGSIEDWNGNTTESESSAYVRKNDVMEDTPLDIGVDYMVFIGNALNNCIEPGVDVEPAIGRYGGRAPYHPISGEAVNKHIDQMTGHGIGRLTPTFDGTQQDREQLKSVLEADIIDQIEVQGKYGVKDYRWLEDSEDSFKEDIIPSDFSFLRKNILERENVSEQDGRPVLKVWNPTSWAGNEEIYNQLSNEYEDWPAMMSDVRSHLEVDGTTPYLIAGTFAGGHREGWRWRNTDKLISEFDAVTTWTASGIWGEDGRTTWDEVMPWVEKNFEGLREFTDQRNLDFIPMVFPGFDDRANDCWGQDRLTPRSQQHFTDLLELANQYRTTDRIDIATWNDWAEGSQIEPGSFRDTQYGTEYLEIIENFQKRN